MRTAWTLLIVAAVLLTACSSDNTEGSLTETTSSAAVPSNGCGAADVVEPGTELLEIDDAGISRAVERVIPPEYDGEEALPLILSLHGFTSTIEQQDLFSGLPQQVAERGYVLLTPQAEDATLTVNGQQITAPFWNIRPDETDGAGLQDDIGFLGRLIDLTMDELCVDPARVYVTGNSNGAGMAATLACALPGRLAAIAPVSGINLAAPCEDLAPVPVVAYHGDSDPLVPYDGASASSTGMQTQPVQDVVGSFASAAGCSEQPRSEPIFDDVVLSEWPECDPGFDIDLYTVVGGGHTWPGMLDYVDVAQLAELAVGMELPAMMGVDVADIAGHMTTNVVATDVMLDFFDAHRLGGG